MARTSPSPTGSEIAPAEGTPPRAAQRRTREDVLSAALGIVDRHGIDGLTMRRLANELGCDPMSLYRHADSKSALLDGVAEIVRDQVTVDPNAPDWQAELTHTAEQFLAQALAHPNVVPLMVSRPVAVPLALQSPGTLRLLEDVLELLIRAGFSRAQALHAYRTFFAFLNGHLRNEIHESTADQGETELLLRLQLHRLPQKTYPRIRELSNPVSTYDGEQELRYGLTVLLAGLEALLYA